MKRNGSKHPKASRDEIAKIIMRAMLEAEMNDNQAIKELPNAVKRLNQKLCRSLNLLEEAKRNLEASDPPKNGYTRDLIGRIKRCLKGARL